MIKNFIRVEEDKEIDFAINMERVNYIQRAPSGNIFIFFTGEELPTRFTGEPAEAIWRYLTGSSLCVRHRPAVEKEVKVESTQTAD